MLARLWVFHTDAPVPAVPRTAPVRLQALPSATRLAAWQDNEAT